MSKNIALWLNVMAACLNIAAFFCVALTHNRLAPVILLLCSAFIMALSVACFSNENGESYKQSVLMSPHILYYITIIGGIISALFILSIATVLLKDSLFVAVSHWHHLVLPIAVAITALLPLCLCLTNLQVNRIVHGSFFSAI
jgi:hypothetical protein